MNGNVTKDGILRDLQWLHRIGVGGVNAIDASLATPQVVAQPLRYMTPGWKDAFLYAAKLTDSMGMELSIDSSPGWSESGGPWVSPQQAMKKLVWSTVSIQGGRHFHGPLPQPPANAGPIQNAPLPVSLLGPPPKSSTLSFYRDSVVLAYPAPDAEPRIARSTSSSGELDATGLRDGDLTNGVVLAPPAGGGKAWIEYDYAAPIVVQGLTLAVEAQGAGGAATQLEASDDGQSWRTVTEVAASKLAEHTVSFAPVTARFFRLTFSPVPPAPLPANVTAFAPGADVKGLLATLAGPSVPLAFRVHEAVLRGAATVNEFEAKADFTIAADNYAIASDPRIAPGSAVRPADVEILTDRVRDGVLDWTPPPGRWVVVRMGYSPTGTENHPAPADATGLEVDKLSREHVRAYAETYFANYASVTGPALIGRRGLNALTIDSTEIGAQNWTENLLADFKLARGYDPSPWLPALTGVVVSSPQDTDKFLWDFRRTIAELLARNHYGEIASMARQRGLTTYTEALEDRRASFGDDMEMRQYADIPMGAMWMYGQRREPYETYVADIRGAASVAHIYGQNLVAAESMTSAMQPWAYAPRQLKPVVDMEFALGVNRVVVHTSVHQPVEKPPGLSLFVFGQFFNRLESWADDAGPWVEYMARSSYLLQQGRFAADIAYFYGEEAPVTGLFGDRPIADAPAGYGFDFVNSDVILHQLATDGGRLVTRSGMRYRLLYLGGSSRYMTLAVLDRIRELVAQGAVLVGRRPLASPSLADDNAKFQGLADAVFGPPGSTGEHTLGRGRVFADGSLHGALAALNVPPDFEFTKPETDTELLALHRRLAKGDLYFVTNRLDRRERVSAAFRVSGRSPEIWNAETGEATPADFRMSAGRTLVPLDLAPYQSLFVVFRKPTTAGARMSPEPLRTPVASLNGPWTLSFQPDRGAPAQTTLQTLQSWSENPSPGIRYFSGSATYGKHFNLSSQRRPSGARLMLDLGELDAVAEVRLNGRPLGTLWNPPFEVDITGAAKRGDNLLEVKVTNLWVNRLIGDAQPGATKKYTFTTMPTYQADAPLRTSGLLGPVRIVSVSAR